MFVDHYTILGVARDADTVQITAAWKRMIEEYHPDLNQSDRNAVEQAKLINAAYETLSDPVKRAQFDASLQKHGNQTQADSEASEFPGVNNEHANASGTRRKSTTNKSKAFVRKKKKRKARKLESLVTLTGIVVGGATAVPIALFLLWVINGSDPAGIFRLPEDTIENNAAEAPTIGEPQDRFVERSDERRQLSQNPAASTNADQATNHTTLEDPNETETSLSEPQTPSLEVAEQSIVDSSEQGDLDPSIDAATEGLLSVPSVVEVAVAKQKLAETFRSDFESAQNESGIGRLVRLRALATEISALLTQDHEPIDEFAIYEVAIDIAKESLFTDTTLELVEEFENRFSVDGLAIRLALFKFWKNRLPTLPSTPESKRSTLLELASDARPFGEDAVDRKDWKLALGFAEVIHGLSIAGGDSVAAARIEGSIDEFRLNLNEEQIVNTLLAELDKNPNQPDKQLKVGRFYCFVMNDWATGLPFLTNSGDPKVARCADEDLNVTAATCKSVGDLWKDLAADREFERYRNAILARAEYAYSGQILGSASVVTSDPKQTSRTEASESGTKSPTIVILQARFGANGMWVDTTASLNKILKRSPPEFINSAAGLGVLDPLPYRAKRTEIKYTIDGVQKSFTLKSKQFRTYNLVDLLK